MMEIIPCHVASFFIVLEHGIIFDGRHHIALLQVDSKSLDL
jgi:hypothetical protein